MEGINTLTPIKWLSKLDGGIRDELKNSRLSPFQIAVTFALLPFSLLLLALADFTTGSSIHKGWISFWASTLSQTSPTPTLTLTLNFFYDAIVFILLLLLPEIIMLLYSRCPNFAKAIMERFGLFALPILLLWHALISLLLFPRTPSDFSANIYPTFWGHVAGLSLVAQYMCYGIILYNIPTPFKDAISKRKKVMLQ